MSEDAAVIPTVNIDVAKERGTTRLISFLFFDYSNRTATNKLNLMGIFDRILVNQETKKTHPFGVFIRTAFTWDRPVNVTAFNPSGEPLAGFIYQIDSAQFPQEKRLSTTQVVFAFEFETPVEGRYWLDVSFDGQSIGGCDLLVEFRKGHGLDGNTTGDA